MSRIRSSGTAPERVVRQLLSRAGIRYRLNVRDLPGKPDFANKTRKFAIFVHGCFWHSHENCALASDPKSNRSYWQPKLERTKARDLAHLERLFKQPGLPGAGHWNARPESLQAADEIAVFSRRRSRFKAILLEGSGERSDRESVTKK